MIDEMPVYVPPPPPAPPYRRDPPRLGPGAPPVPPAKRRDERWRRFGLRLWIYRMQLKKWVPSQGWTVADRDTWLAEALDMAAWVRKQKDAPLCGAARGAP